MNVDARRTRSLGEILGYAYRVYASRFVPLFGIALISAPLSMLSVAITRQIDDTGTAEAVALLLQLPASLVGLVATAALIHALHPLMTTGGTVDIAGAIDAALSDFWRLFKSIILYVIMVGLAAVAAPLLAIWWLIKKDANIDGRRDWYFALIPGVLAVYVAIRWAFVPYAVLIERVETWAALDRSAELVRWSWWRTLGIIVAVSFVVLGPLLLAQTAIGAHPFVEATVSAAASALIHPYSVAAQLLLYYDLSARKADHASPV